MSLAQAVTDNLPEFRRQAESLMVDTCTITAPGSGTTFDPDTGEYVTNPGATAYSGKCQIQVPGDVSMQEVTAGEQVVVISRITVKIPISAGTVPVNSTVAVTAVGGASDPSLVGAEYRVTGSHAKTYATARRIPCELVTP